MKKILVLNADQEVELLRNVLSADFYWHRTVSRILTIEKAVKMFEASCSVELVVMDPYGNAFFIEQ